MPTCGCHAPHGSWRGRRSGRRSPSSGRRLPCPGFMVTPSRIMQSEPMVSVDGSPWIFQILRADGRWRRRGRCACGRRCVVRPATTTWLTSSQPSPSSTSGPTMQNGPIFDALAELRAVLDDRRSDGCTVSHHSITSMALTSASQTTLPSTLASPLYHHMLRRLFSLRMWYSTRSPGTTGLRNFALSMVMK